MECYAAFFASGGELRVGKGEEVGEMEMAVRMDGRVVG